MLLPVGPLETVVRRNVNVRSSDSSVSIFLNKAPIGSPMVHVERHGDVAGVRLFGINVGSSR